MISSITIKRRARVECACDDFTIAPEPGLIVIGRICIHFYQCRICRGIVTDERNREYNQYIGTAGFDEFEDHNE